MNEKASVSRELDARHRKILEGLLRLPENKECADCKSKRPRWASVNLGIFVCMQCSGIHRSMGVHISKVRSATLDTWLPEQVAFIQTMGNEKSNSYWEAELPPHYDRVGIENFIRAKYEEKRWVPKQSAVKPRVKIQEETRADSKRDSGNRGGNGSSDNVEPLEKRNKPPSAIIKIPMPPKGPNEVLSGPKSEPAMIGISSLESPEKTIADDTLSTQPPDLDYATDLFDILSVEGPTENGKDSSSVDDNGWASFQSAEVPSCTEKSNTEPSESKAPSSSGIEDIFKNSSPVTLPLGQEKSPEIVKNDIMSLFEKSSMVSPYSIQQQQLAFLSQQQAFLMNTLNSGNMPSKIPATAHQEGSSASIATNGNTHWPNLGYQTPLVPPLAEQIDPRTISQSGSIKPAHSSGDFGSLSTSSMESLNMDALADGAAKEKGSGFSTSDSVDHFSSLTQGFFSKH